MFLLVNSDVRQKARGALHVGGMQDARVPQMALTLGALFRQDVATVGMAALESARGRLPETLRRAPVGFHFWHFNTPTI
jgi:hypothetical protein